MLPYVVNVRAVFGTCFNLLLTIEASLDGVASQIPNGPENADLQRVISGVAKAKHRLNNLCIAIIKLEEGG